MKVSAIEIGTNSMKFIILEYSNGKVSCVLDRISKVNRLSEGMYRKNGAISDEAMDKGLKIAKDYLDCSASHQAHIISIFSTSVLRDAANKRIFMEKMYNQTGISVEILSGDMEAYFAYKACRFLFAPMKKRFSVIDIGGGSTEITVGSKYEIHHSISLNLGAVRLKERFIRNEPIGRQEIDEMTKYIENTIKNEIRFDLSGVQFIGTGGSVKSLGTIYEKLDYQFQKQINGIVIKKNIIDKIFVQLLNKSLQERMQVIGLNPKRADVIIAGIDILLCVMNRFKVEEVTISTNGVLEGFIEDYLVHNAT